ncbi:hypothetical protein ATN83_1480 [Raoultella ornithinolytica]|jgi:hypothetical protein|nr:hypothetical protein ATN83_1480 [Raoultella ornithinolytica]KDV92763.1 hypothetical protein AB00_3411 [Raoultella ornithinolytica 2-156-04_S1_C1]KDX13490.1 hypothetical protein AB28_3418 [Raoultella ornithinolytica 2-156-04_S1_C2]
MPMVSGSVERSGEGISIRHLKEITVFDAALSDFQHSAGVSLL